MNSEEATYKDYLEYIRGINGLEQRLMVECGEKVKNIGISIQLYEELQDDYSPTREHTTAINCYCKSIQEADNGKGKERCNLFDKQAKEYYFNDILLKKVEYSSEKPYPLLCFCHANVTNYLFMFNPLEISKYKEYSFVYEGVNIYIFIGHFLLKEFPNDIKKNKLELYGESDGGKYDLINKFKPVESDIYNKTCDKNKINTATFNDLGTIKDKINEEIYKHFISNGYLAIDTDNKIISFTKKFIEINNIPSLDKISALLKEISEQILILESIPDENKSKFNEIKRKISKEIKKTRAIIQERRKDNAENTDNEIDIELKKTNIKEWYIWLLEGKNEGVFGIKKWLNRFKK